MSPRCGCQTVECGEPRFTGTRHTESGRKTSKSSDTSTENGSTSTRGYLASLELRKLYQVVDDPEAEVDGMLRVIDESGEDYLFPSSMFMLAPLPASVEEALLHVVETAG